MLLGSVMMSSSCGEVAAIRYQQIKQGNGYVAIPMFPMQGPIQLIGSTNANSSQEVAPRRTGYVHDPGILLSLSTAYAIVRGRSSAPVLGYQEAEA